MPLDADFIVTGGRALGGRKGFDLLREFADLVGGAVGASRAAVDSGWIEYAHQAGQTVQPIGMASHGPNAYNRGKPAHVSRA